MSIPINRFPMKRLSTLLLVCLISLTVFGQTESEILTKANDLIAHKKYESAFKELEGYDPKNEKPDIVLLKEELALNYFVTSMEHQMFAFKDIEINENVQDYRGKQGSSGMYTFPANEILEKLLKEYPDNYKLNKGLGDFYYDALQRYQGNWLKPDSILLKLIVKNYQVAIHHQLADFSVYYKVGLEMLEQKKYKESISYFLESIKLKNNHADAHYNLAFAYLFSDDLKNALKYALNAYDMYRGKANKDDAARMTGQIYTEMKDDKNAIEYYEIANNLEPDNYYNLHPLLDLYVRTKSTKEKEALNSFYNLAPDKPTIYNNLADIYLGNSKTNELIEFYLSKLPQFENDKKVSGNLHFYLGKLYLNSDKGKAKEYFLEAKARYSAVYAKTNDVFKTIDLLLKEASK